MKEEQKKERYPITNNYIGERYEITDFALNSAYTVLFICALLIGFLIF